MAAAAVMEWDQDPVAFRAVQILVSLRSRKLRERPEWLPAPAREAASSSPGTAAPEERWDARRPRSGGRRGSPVPWTKALRLPDLAAAAGSGGVAERDAAVEAALCHGAPAGSGSPSTSHAARALQTRPRHAGEMALAAAAPAQESMKASSPVTPLDYGAGGSGASSSADDGARPQAKRKGLTAPGYGGGGDDEGCSLSAKRARAPASEEKPIPAELSTESETCASSGKGFVFDLNLPPPSDDAGGCPDAW